MNRFKTKKGYKGKLSFFLLVSLVLSGCGVDSANAPDLVEPVISNESYRPVEYGDIGNATLLNGIVVPTDYCHFWKANTAVAKINVEIGEYVEKGTVLASANVDYVKDVMDSISAERANYVSSYRTSCEIYELQLEELEYKLKGFQELKDKEGIKNTKTEIDVLKENHRYDERLYKHKVSRYDAQLSEQREILENGTLTARASGYVTYVKDLSFGNNVKTAENVVIVSDYEDVYVEIKDTLFSTNIFERYESCYAIIDEKKYEIEEYKYLPNESLVAQSGNIGVNLRAKFVDETKTPDIGNSVPILCRKELHEEVLYVGKDSLYQDEEGSFVYIKNGEDREVRYVETGAKDDYHVEICSGLTEGELVYYSSEAVAPDEYTVYTAEVGDYADIRKTEKTLKITTTKKIIFSDYEGEFIEMGTRNRDISEGALLCTIKVNEGSAALASMRNSMEKLKAAYEKQNAAFEEQIKALEKQKEEIEKKEKAKKKEKKKQEATTETNKSEEASTEQKNMNVTVETEQSGTGDINQDTTATDENNSATATTTESETAKPETTSQESAAETEAGTTESETTSQESVTETEAGSPEPSESEPSAEEAKKESDNQEPGGETSQDEPVIRPYFTKEIDRQIECVKLSKEQARRDYLYQLNTMQKQYNEASSNNDGTGVVSIYSEYEGAITEVNISSGKKIEMGERICTIEAPASPYVYVMTEGDVSLNQEVEFVDEGLEKTFKGKVVGLAGDTMAKKSFINTVDDKVYITNSLMEGDISGAFGPGAFVKVEDSDYFTEFSVSKEKEKYVKYSMKNVQGMVVLPRGIVNEEVAVKDGEISYYVWKIMNGELVKHYVQYLESAVDAEGYRIDCILGGIKEGDKLVRVEESK